jgi:hypothetical protein
MHKDATVWPTPVCEQGGGGMSGYTPTPFFFACTLLTQSQNLSPPPPASLRPPQVTELLLQAGADPAELNPRGSNALEMGANQGSWRELHVLLRTHPDLPQRLGKPPPDPRMGYDPSEHTQGLRGMRGEGRHGCGGPDWSMSGWHVLVAWPAPVKGQLGKGAGGLFWMVAVEQGWLDRGVVV